LEQQLAGIDSAFLSLETEHAPLHVAATIVLEPSPHDGSPADYQGIRRHLAPRLSRLPIFRRRIQEVPLRLDHPFWLEEAELDLDAHLHRVAVPAPGSRRELAELVGHLASRPLDRDLPLWELWVLEGLEQGRTALLAKLHHALIDGVAGASILAQLLDVSREGSRDVPAAPSPERKPAPRARAMLLAAAVGVASLPMRAAQQIWQTARRGAGIARAMIGEVAPAGTSLMAPTSCLNGALSPRRCVALGEVPLERLEDVKRAFGVKLNDVVLAACAGALRSCLTAWGDSVREPLVAAVPVAVPRSGDAGNAVSVMRVELPVQLAHPVERLLECRRSARRAKRVQRAAGGKLLAGWAELAMPWLLSGLTDLYSRLGLADYHPPLANLVISNVPGPTEPLFCAGHEVRGCHPLGPIYEGWALNLTVLSYAGRVQMGLMACPSVVQEPARICDAFDEAVAELHRAAARGASPSGGPRRRRRARRAAVAGRRSARRAAAGRTAPDRSPGAVRAASASVLGREDL
jgi:diacylglycerol O-acyltransferase